MSTAQEIHEALEVFDVDLAHAIAPCDHCGTPALVPKGTSPTCRMTSACRETCGGRYLLMPSKT